MTIEELKTYFNSVKLPDGPLQLNPSHKILDVQLFVNSHLSALAGKALPLDAISKPVYNRLVQLHHYIEEELSKLGT